MQGREHPNERFWRFEFSTGKVAEIFHILELHLRAAPTLYHTSDPTIRTPLFSTINRRLRRSWIANDLRLFVFTNLANYDPLTVGVLTRNSDAARPLLPLLRPVRTKGLPAGGGIRFSVNAASKSFSVSHVLCKWSGFRTTANVQFISQLVRVFSPSFAPHLTYVE